MNCKAAALAYFAAAMVFAAVSADEDGGLTSSPSAVFKKVSFSSRHNVILILGHQSTAVLSHLS